MEYAIPLILVLVIVTAGILAFVMNSRQKTSADGHDRVADDDSHSGGPGIGTDPTPLGDSAEHAGRQDADGRTVSPPDAVRYGGTGHPVDHYGATVPEERESRDDRDRNP